MDVLPGMSVKSLRHNSLLYKSIRCRIENHNSCSFQRDLEL